MQNRRWQIFKGQIRRSIIQKSRLDWSVVLICLVLASAVWLITELGKTYSDTISIPATFEFDETAFTATEPLPRKVKLKVTGTGWSLVKHQLGFSRSRLTLYPEKDHQTGCAYFSTRRIYQNVMAQMPDLKVSYMFSDSLNFVLDPIIERQVGLVLDSNTVRIGDGLNRTSPITIHPARLSLKGTKKELDLLGNQILVRLTRKNYNTDVEEVVPIGHQEFPKIIFPQQEALVSFTIGRLTNQLVRVPIINQCPYPINADSIGLICELDVRKLNALAPDSFRVSAQEISEHPKIALRIEKTPRFALNTSLSDLTLGLKRLKKAKF